MSIESVNPATGETLARFTPLDTAGLDEALTALARAQAAWAVTPIAQRAQALHALAGRLRARRDDYARLITLEMGKPIKEARAEVEKCAYGCEHLATRGPDYLRDEPVASEARAGLVTYQPIGTVLAVMPWNFPFWQVFRAGAGVLLAGNALALKHAANVPQCALAIEAVFREAGFPEDLVRALLIESRTVEGVIADPRIHAVTLTGSEAAGRAVARAAGAQLKKTVLELGGSDPFVVLEDADLDAAARAAVIARFQNNGQSCIAAKRLVLVVSIADAFIERFEAAARALRRGDPLREDTDLGPLAREDLRAQLHAQVEDARMRGARLVFGDGPTPGPGFFYAPALLDGLHPNMRAYHEELFGPVATVLRVGDEAEAVRAANDTPYGLGGSVWTRDRARGERVARALACGSAFVNAVVKSDPRLPFGGVKASGYGRELSAHGTREFTNIKTVWVG